MSQGHSHTAEEIRSRLTEAFAPVHIEVRDDSPRHAGHAEAKAHPTAGHFHVVIVSEQFKGKSMIQRHRMIYASLGDLMKTSIHALSIEANESASMPRA